MKTCNIEKTIYSISASYYQELRRLICEFKRELNNQNCNKEKIIHEFEKNKITGAILNDNIIASELERLANILKEGTSDINEFKDAIAKIEDKLFTEDMIYKGNGDNKALVGCPDNILGMFLNDMIYENGFASGYVNDFDELLCVLKRAYPDILMLDLDMIEQDDEKISALSACSHSDLLLVAIVNPGYLEYIDKYDRLFIWDYVVKPFNPKEINYRVNIDIERFNYFKGQCLKDSLTGAYNKVYFMERLHQEYIQYCRNKKPFTVMFLDIDEFKKINDTYGHIFGDKVLKEFSSAIISSLRGNDVFCRYGGDEFAVLMPDTDAERAKKAAQRITELVSGIDIGYKISFSIGIKEVDTYVTTYEEVLKMADEAMYTAKKSHDKIQVIKEIKGNTIIVIDGGEEVTQTLKRSLQGGEIVLLHPDSIDSIKDYNPSIILINDIHPSVRGREILQKIGEDITTKIFYITGEKDISSIKGVDVIFCRPYSMTELENEIYKFIG